MKYIRTKDGIYRNASVPTDLVIICRDRECEVNPSDIIKQADTIEELCDCKVYISENKNETPYLEYPCRKYDFLNEKYEIVYGAIWTGKGLIYVAKMNDEGELELL